MQMCFCFIHLTVSLLIQVASIVAGEKTAQTAAKKLTSEALKVCLLPACSGRADEERQLGSMDNVTALVVDLREMLTDMGPSTERSCCKVLGEDEMKEQGRREAGKAQERRGKKEREVEVFTL
eukprot:755029-Hanusia_phi.AAC.11